MTPQKLRSIRFANDQHWPAAKAGYWKLVDVGYWKAQSAFGAAGPIAERGSDVFSESRASSLVKGFENAAPAWLAKRSPAAASLFLSVPIRVIRG
jgi:hypothetical protein